MMQDKYYFVSISESLKKEFFNITVVKAAQQVAPA